MPMTSAAYFLEKCRDLGRAAHHQHFFLRRLKDPAFRKIWQNAQWQKLLAHAKSHSPFYAKHLAGVTAQTPLKDLPVLSKKIILDNFDSLITTTHLNLQRALRHLDALQHDGYFNHLYKIFRSGGSSGSPGIMVYSPKEFALVLAQILRSSQGLICPPKTRRLRGANIYASTPTHDSIRISQSFQVGCHVVRDFSADLAGKILVKALNQFNPDVLSGYPSKIFELAFSKMKGDLIVQPKAIFLGSEPLTPHMREIILKAFGINPFDHYGTTEAIVMATECHLHRGLHLEDDLHFIEILDENNRPTQPGKLGHKVFVTNLTAFTQPIIRYELSDLILLHDDFNSPCPCGHPGRLIQRIVGRSEDIFSLPTSTGKFVLLPPQVFQTLLGVFDEVQQFQLMKTDHHVALNVQIREGVSTDEIPFLRTRLENSLRLLFEEHCVMGVSIEITCVEGFRGTPSASQKFKQIWNQSS